MYVLDSLMHNITIIIKHTKKQIANDITDRMVELGKIISFLASHS